MAKRILVIGAGVRQVPLIKRIKENGYEVYCVDLNPEAPGFSYADGHKIKDVLDKDACLLYARELNIDAVMTFGATLTLPTVSYIGTVLDLPVISMPAAEISRNKYIIKEKLAKSGCNIFGNYFVMHKTDSIKNKEVKYPCVIKPSDGSGSTGVSIIRSEDELAAGIENAFSGARYGEIYYEELIEGQEYSVEAFVNEGKVYVYVIVKTTMEENGATNEEIEYGHRTPAGLPKEVAADIRNEATKAVNALGVNMGSVNFDVIIADKDGKPYIIDCGIRVGQNLISSHLIPLSRGISVIDNTIEQALGNPIDPEPSKRDFIATRLLIYNPGVIKEIKSTDELIGKDGIVDIVWNKRLGETQKVFRDKSDTCGWVVCKGDTPDEAESNASKARKEIKKYITIEAVG